MRKDLLTIARECGAVRSPRFGRDKGVIEFDTDEMLEAFAARVRGVPADTDCATCRHASLRESDEPCRSCIEDIRVYRNHSPLCATPPAPAAQAGDAELKELRIMTAEVARQIAEGEGFWRSCSGCYELNEGHDTGPFSSIFQCALGNGCSECGGLGAVWDNTDYEEMARCLAEDEAQPAPEQAAPAPAADTKGGA